MKERHYIIFNSQKPVSMLRKITYTDDENLLHPKSVVFNRESVDVNLIDIGVYKNTYWSFQNEYRYIFYVSPVRGVLTNNGITEFIENINQDVIFAPFNYYDMVLSDEAFSKMEIVLSPKITAGNKIIANSLVEKFNPNARIMESKLSGIIH